MVSITTARVHHKFDFHRPMVVLGHSNEFRTRNRNNIDSQRTAERCLFDDFYWHMNTKLHDRTFVRPEARGCAVHCVRCTSLSFFAQTQLKYYSSFCRFTFLFHFISLFFGCFCSIFISGAFYFPSAASLSLHKPKAATRNSVFISNDYDLS